jgi:hypothetical protein
LASRLDEFNWSTIGVRKRPRLRAGICASNYRQTAKLFSEIFGVQPPVKRRPCLSWRPSPIGGQFYHLQMRVPPRCHAAEPVTGCATGGDGGEFVSGPLSALGGRVKAFSVHGARPWPANRPERHSLETGIQIIASSGTAVNWSLLFLPTDPRQDCAAAQRRCRLSAEIIKSFRPIELQPLVVPAHSICLFAAT